MLLLPSGFRSGVQLGSNVSKGHTGSILKTHNFYPGADQCSGETFSLLSEGSSLVTRLVLTLPRNMPPPLLCFNPGTYVGVTVSVNIQSVLSRVSVIKTRFWIGESVYWFFTSRNYN
jgi:hypothetical protein